MPYSVVLTTFNCSSTIMNAISSIMNLSPPPDEIVIIDDASQDDTVNKISFATLDLANVKLIINAINKGQSYSRNLGVKESKTENIIIMDDDDFSYSNRAKVHLAALAKGVDVSYVSSLKVYPNGYKVEVRNSDFTSSPEISLKIIKHLITGVPLANSLKLFSPSCSLAFKKSSFLKLNGFREDLRRLEDIEFACRSLRSGLALNWSSEISLERFHTVGDDKSAKANFDGELAVLESVRDLLGIRDYFVAKEMTLFRKLYFEKNFSSMLKKSYLFPVLVLIAPSKVLTVFKRFRHDFQRKI